MLTISSKIKSYTVEFIDQVLTKKEELFPEYAREKRFYFIDANVFTLYKDAIERFVGTDPFCVIEALEGNKEYSSIARYYAELIDSGFKRNHTLITIGGGILQDISGFITSTLYRGVPWIFFPTTLLAQADSCIGSKTSINFRDAKNLIGSFYPPDKIYIDTAFCGTLSESYFNSGIGEIVKFHLLSDMQGYGRLRQYLAESHLRNDQYLRPILESTLTIKQSYFEGDEFDTGRRNLLNYGHCFGHALESASNFAVCHGEAVLLGMGFANRLSLQRGIMTNAIFSEIEEIIAPLYPRYDLSQVSAEKIIEFMKRDKKRVGNNLSVILAHGIGSHRKYDDVTEYEVEIIYSAFVKERSTI